MRGFSMNIDSRVNESQSTTLGVEVLVAEGKIVRNSGNTRLAYGEWSKMLGESTVRRSFKNARNLEGSKPS